MNSLSPAKIATSITITILIYFLLIGFSFDYASPYKYFLLFIWSTALVGLYLKLENTSWANSFDNFLIKYIGVGLLTSFVVIHVFNVNRTFNKSVEYASCTVTNFLKAPPHSKMSHIDKLVIDLHTDTAENISPILLNSYFKLGGDGTDLQRENIENSIKNRVVVWKLKIYEVARNKDGSFQISTQTGVVDSRSQIEKSVQGIVDLASVLTLNRPSYSQYYENQNIGTDIKLTLLDAADTNYLNTLKTGSWITVRGKIQGVTLRRVDISPAIIEKPSNSAFLATALDKESNFILEMDKYKNRSCSHVFAEKAAGSSNENKINSVSGAKFRTDMPIDEVVKFVAEYSAEIKTNKMWSNAASWTDLVNKFPGLQWRKIPNNNTTVERVNDLDYEAKLPTGNYYIVANGTAGKNNYPAGFYSLTIQDRVSKVPDETTLKSIFERSVKAKRFCTPIYGGGYDTGRTYVIKFNSNKIFRASYSAPNFNSGYPLSYRYHSLYFKLDGDYFLDDYLRTGDKSGKEDC